MVKFNHRATAHKRRSWLRQARKRRGVPCCCQTRAANRGPTSGWLAPVDQETLSSRLQIKGVAGVCKWPVFAVHRSLHQGCFVGSGLGQCKPRPASARAQRRTASCSAQTHGAVDPVMGAR